MANDNAVAFYRKAINEEPSEELLEKHDRLQAMWQKNCVGDVPPPTMLWLAYSYCLQSNGKQPKEEKEGSVPLNVGAEVLYTGDGGMARNATVKGFGKFGRVKIEYEGTTKEVQRSLLARA